MEEFKIYDYYGVQYKVSNYGRIWNLKTGKELHGRDSNGYRRVTLRNSKLKIYKDIMIHRLVAELFLPNPNPEVLIEINHKDCNRANNYVENLEWVTHDQNVKYAAKLKHYNNKGDRNPNAKLTREQAEEIRVLRKTTNLTLQQLADKYNVSNGMIQRIVYNKNWV